MFFTSENIFVSGDGANYRIPVLVATKRGTFLAFCNNRKNTCSDHAAEVELVMRRCEREGAWEETVILASRPGWSFMINSAVYDDATDTVFLTAARTPVRLNEFGSYTDEERRRAAERADVIAREAGIVQGDFLLVSTDDGKTFTERPYRVTPTAMDVDGVQREFVGFSHGSGSGIRLKNGRNAGRLAVPARFMTKHYTKIDGLQDCGFNNVLWSDDHGETWHSGGPVQPGTGEGAIIERADGSILLNSRAYFHDGKRYLAVSHDGGETFGEFTTDPFLLENTESGCNASLLRAETPEGILTLFANPRSDGNRSMALGRRRMTVCVSRDDGKSWFHTKLIREGPSGYSALAYAGGRFCLLYELGEKNSIDMGLAAAEFDAEWLLSE